MSSFVVVGRLWGSTAISALVNVLSLHRHNKSVHAVCSCGHSLENTTLVNFQSSGLCRLHVFNFHTAIFACVVDNVIIIFLTDLRGCSGFFVFRNYLLRFRFQLYHGDKMIPWWTICIWRSTTVQHVQI